MTQSTSRSRPGEETTGASPAPEAAEMSRSDGLGSDVGRGIPIATYLDLSTAHVTEAEMRAIDGSCDRLPVSALYAYGAWLYVPEPDEEDDASRAIEYPNVNAILLRARALGAAAVRLDADGDRTSALPTFEW
jgi:hypothetical protein